MVFSCQACDMTNIILLCDSDDIYKMKQGILCFAYT